MRPFLEVLVLWSHSVDGCVLPPLIELEERTSCALLQALIAVPGALHLMQFVREPLFLDDPGSALRRNDDAMSDDSWVSFQLMILPI